MRRLYASLLVFATISFAPLISSAAPIPVPTDLNPGDQYRLVFVTSTSRDATSSNIGDYNTFVTAAANSVPELLALGTVWKAIGSTPSIDARDNTGTNPSSTGVPIYRLDDKRVADNNADLWDSILADSILVNELGVNFSGNVRTGTLASGLKSAGLELGAATNSTVGLSGALDSRWTNVGSFSVTIERPVYAMSEIMTVVPEPSTLALAAFGLEHLPQLPGAGDGGTLAPRVERPVARKTSNNLAATPTLGSR